MEYVEQHGIAEHRAQSTEHRAQSTEHRAQSTELKAQPVAQHSAAQHGIAHRMRIAPEYSPGVSRDALDPEGGAPAARRRPPPECQEGERRTLRVEAPRPSPRTLEPLSLPFGPFSRGGPRLGPEVSFFFRVLEFAAFSGWDRAHGSRQKSESRTRIGPT